MEQNIYINAIKHISAQKPMSEDWFYNPILYNKSYVQSIDEDYKKYFSPNEIRRLGKLLKRALLTAVEATKASGIDVPDAIIAGTGLGCIENTELFLDNMIRHEEQFLNPTQFMNSTHNTISSVVAIYMACRGYNSTYTHKGLSYENAMLDAFMQLQNSRINQQKNVLVISNDELTPVFFNLLEKSKYLGQKNQTFASEISVAMMLSTQNLLSTICRVKSIDIVYGNISDAENIIPSCSVDAIMTGINGFEPNDKGYWEFCEKYFPKTPILQYKNIFGESYSSSATAVYAAAECLKQNIVPKYMYVENQNNTKVNTILCYNLFDGKYHSFILLTNK